MRLTLNPTRRELFFEASLSAVALVLIACWAACSSGRPSTNSGPPPLAAALGGSDYGWYHLDAPCSREPYGVVYNYDTATATINAQLQQMYSNGQRRLRIPIYFARGINSGTIMDSTGATSQPHFQTNLTNLLAVIKAVFVEIEVSFHLA